jgi:hypothetical protein
MDNRFARTRLRSSRLADDIGFEGAYKSGPRISNSKGENGAKRYNKPT